MANNLETYPGGIQQYLEDNYGIRSGGAADDFYGTTSYDPAASYSGRTSGNAYAGGTNGSSYGGWLGTNPLSGNNAFSGNTGSLGLGPNNPIGYDPRMAMKDHGSHNNGGSAMSGGGGGGGRPQQGQAESGQGPYGTGTSWQGVSPIGAGGGQKFGGGMFDAPGGLKSSGEYAPSNARNAVAQFSGRGGGMPADSPSGVPQGLQSGGGNQAWENRQRPQFADGPSDGQDGSGRMDGGYANNTAAYSSGGTDRQPWNGGTDPNGSRGGQNYPNSLQAGQIEGLMSDQYQKVYGPFPDWNSGYGNENIMAE